MELFLIFSGAFITAFSGAMAPGPMTALTISQTLKNGWKAGPLIVLGHAILEIFMLTLIISGFSNFLTLDIVKTVIYLTGGILLLTMGIHMLFNTTNIADFSNNTDNRSKSSIISGILVSLANPYWSIWWLSIGLAYILKALPYGIKGIIIFFIGHILADLLWFSGLAAIFHKSKNYLKQKAYNTIFSVCAISLIIFSFWFLASAIFKL